MENIELLSQIILGKRVRDARKRAKMTQPELAKNAKCSVTTINRLEKGRQIPHTSTLIQIAKALNLPPSELVIEKLHNDIEQTTKGEEKHSESTSREKLITDIITALPALKESELRDLRTLALGYARITVKPMNVKKITS